MSSKSRKQKIRKELETARNKAIVLKLSGHNNCRGCEYLYSRETSKANLGYIDEEVHCALNKNPNLSGSEPYVVPIGWLRNFSTMNRIWQPDFDKPLEGTMCGRYSPLRPHMVPVWFALEDDSVLHGSNRTQGLTSSAKKAVMKHVVGDIISTSPTRNTTHVK